VHKFAAPQARFASSERGVGPTTIGLASPISGCYHQGVTIAASLPTIPTMASGLPEAWGLPTSLPVSEFSLALDDPRYRAQFWQGVLTRVGLPHRSWLAQAWFQVQDPSRLREDAFAFEAWTIDHVRPVAPRHLGDLQDAILEGLVQERVFTAHDLLRYRGQWVFELPFYMRRVLLEQAFDEAVESGQAVRGAWGLAELLPSVVAIDVQGRLDPAQVDDLTLRRLDASYGPGGLDQPSMLTRRAPYR
jgi:hypothetical protein